MDNAMKAFKVFLCSLTLIVPFSSFAQDKPVGKVIAIAGKVEFRTVKLPTKPGANEDVKTIPAAFTPWDGAKTHQPVFKNDIFKTNKRSRIKIKFEDNSLMALGPNSELKVEDYFFKSDQKLRQAVINVAHGFAMYIVNKSQKNKDSSFRIVAPTANLAARGTQGFISSFPTETVIANQAGNVFVRNANKDIPGEVSLGPMSYSVVPLNKPPTPQAPLTERALNTIKRGVLGLNLMGGGAGSLIKVKAGSGGGDEEEESSEGEDGEGEDSFFEGSDSGEGDDSSSSGCSP